MSWYALRPRDPADPRWPLPASPVIRLKAEDPAAARAAFAQAYPSAPFATPAAARARGFADDPDALLVEAIAAPPAPEAA